MSDTKSWMEGYKACMHDTPKRAMNPGMLTVGDKVAYSAAWLRSTGQQTGDVPFARGVIKGFQSIGSTTIAVVDWDRDMPPKVNVKNLARVGGARFSANPRRRNVMRHCKRRNPDAFGHTWTLAEIRYVNEHQGNGLFFSRKTMKFFGDKMSNFGVRHVGGRIIIYRKRSTDKLPGGKEYLFDPKTGRITTLSANRGKRRKSHRARKPRPGSGKRFSALAKKFRRRGVKCPRCLAAYVGRRKYGKKRMQQMARTGRRRAHRR